jgi:hypothetical protein
VAPFDFNITFYILPQTPEGALNSATQSPFGGLGLTGQTEPLPNFRIEDVGGKQNMESHSFSQFVHGLLSSENNNVCEIIE